ncbi:MAG TPA: DUF6657 family protein [Spirochaetia bacterium]|nr:DUF6657 family protein [Spirochaetia bacterium]
MARIKSALELALERTQDVQGDKAKLDEFEGKQRGRRVYAQLAENPELDVRKALQEASATNAGSAEEGFVDALLANIGLPNETGDIERLKVLKRGFEAITKDRKVAQIFTQLEQFYQQYLSNKQQLIEAIRKQFEPRLRRKEEELARQTGQRVRLDPAADPEFATVLKQNLGKLQSQFNEVLDQVRGELAAMRKTDR